MSRSRIPNPREFAAIGIDQEAMLDHYLRELEAEVSGLKDGTIWTERHGRAYYFQLASKRMERLTKLANDFGFWLEDAKAV